ncbi:MAG: RNA ligase [Acidimicrobiales bacterium]
MERFTTTCRGLVVEDGTARIIARPLPKFFTYAEHGQMAHAPPLPPEPYRIYDKLDGTLGIVFAYRETWQVASKGSFVSDQKRWAQRWIDDRVLTLKRLDASLTYCAEIVCPENRIVVDYGTREDLVLLAAFRADGEEVPLDDIASHCRDDARHLAGGGIRRPRDPMPRTLCGSGRTCSSVLCRSALQRTTRRCERQCSLYSMGSRARRSSGGLCARARRWRRAAGVGPIGRARGRAARAGAGSGGSGGRGVGRLGRARGRAARAGGQGVKWMAWI